MQNKPCGCTTECGCCSGSEALTPMPIANRPGLDALAYRVGTHATFVETMKARLASAAVEITRTEPDAAGDWRDKLYPLQGLTTRTADDPAIALLDSWGTVADVLTFYQERIANEGYLRTATERRSVAELARLVGYTLRPGVAASVYLALTLDPGYKTVLEPGQVRAQSIPGPGEFPQTFENSERVESRADWNVLKPRLTQPQTPQSIQGDPQVPGSGPRVYLKGISTNLKVNDPLLIDIGAGEPIPFRVTDVKPDPLADRTLVKLRPWQARAQIGAAELATALREWSGRQRTTEADRIGVSDDVTYKTAVKALDHLQEFLRTETTFPGIVDFVQQTMLPALMQLLQMAEDRSYNRLQQWLGGMLTELNDILQEAERQRAESLARAFGMPPTKMSTEISAEFKSVLTGIAKPASVPPRSAPALQQSVATTFQPNADSGLQVVNAFRPDLNAALSVAVANTKVTPESAVKVFAPRLKTGVYANSAPLKPVYDDDGRVSSYEEWSLTGAKTLKVQFLRQEFGAPDQVIITFGQGSAVYRTTLTSETPEGRVGPLSARRTIPLLAAGWGIELELLRDEKKFRNITCGGLHESIGVAITTPQQEFSRTIEQGQMQRFASMGDRVEIDFRKDPQEKLILTVIDEMLLPPDPKNVIALDAQYDQISQDSWVVIQRSDEAPPRFGRVALSAIAAKTDYNFPARVTQLTMEEGQDWLKETDLLLSDIRGTTVYTQSEELALADEVIETPICGGADDLIELDGLYRDLQAGRWLIISGERTDIEDANQQIVSGIKSSELVMLDAVVHTVAVAPGDGQSLDEGDQGDAGSSALPGDKKHTYIRLAKKLEYCYKRNVVTIYGNVVKATHGETRHETLGSGDGSKALQSFTMRQPPLTYVAASTPAGAESTLQIYVNDLQWHESDALAGRQANDRLFITRTDDEGKTSVTFGNGRQGARLPTGMENVKAVYRNGIGKPGNVQAEQISLLMTRPLGVRGVINPLRASGGADKENRDSARRNAPLAVTALDRLVSVQDYADFARTFAGIGKAAASTWNNSTLT